MNNRKLNNTILAAIFIILCFSDIFISCSSSRNVKGNAYYASDFLVHNIDSVCFRNYYIILLYDQSGSDYYILSKRENLDSKNISENNRLKVDSTYYLTLDEYQIPPKDTRIGNPSIDCYTLIDMGELHGEQVYEKYCFWYKNKIQQPVYYCDQLVGLYLK